MPDLVKFRTVAIRTFADEHEKGYTLSREPVYGASFAVAIRPESVESVREIEGRFENSDVPMKICVLQLPQCEYTVRGTLGEVLAHLAGEDGELEHEKRHP